MKVEFDIDMEEKSIIKVIGVGGGGCNAVSYMYQQGIVGVDFAICNTDNQSLQNSPVPVKIQLGPNLTEGRGAGSKPEVGREACIESIDDVKRFLEDGTKMLFIACGMGGGTGTGAAPIISKAARELGILTIGIVTLPFGFEGKKRKSYAHEGIELLKDNVDACIVVSNDRLREVYGNLPLSGAFNYADNILSTAAKGIAEIITVSGYINVDFEDVNTVMRNSGMAIMGVAEAEGDNRAIEAVTQALNSPLLEDNDISGAKDILLNICSGNEEITFDEVSEITDYIRDQAGDDVNIIWGSSTDDSLGANIMVTVIATGFDDERNRRPSEDVVTQESINDSYDSREVKQQQLLEPKEDRIVISLDDEVNRSDVYENFNNSESDRSEPRKNVLNLDVNTAMDEVVRNRYTNSDPYLKKKDGKKSEEKSDETYNNEIKFINSYNISELENQPAYLRKRVKLENVEKSTEFKRSTTVVDSEQSPEIRKENPYLYDNVD